MSGFALGIWAIAVLSVEKNSLIAPMGTSGCSEGKVSAGSSSSCPDTLTKGENYTY